MLFGIAFLILFTTTVATSADVQSLCADFDARIERLDVKGAHKVIEEAHRAAPSSYEVLFRMARIHVLLGDEHTDKDKQLRYYEQAVDYADKAIHANGKGLAGYLYRAAGNGKIALFKGIFSVADIVKKVRDDAWYAINLNNDIPDRLAAAHYILGRAHLALSYKAKIFRSPLGLGWGNIDDAHTHLKKARELRPNFIMFELEYARCLLEQDHEQQAHEILRRIASMKSLEPGDSVRKKEAKELLED